MKKKILLITLLSISAFGVFALSNKFTIDSSKFSFSKNYKQNSVTNEFNKDYALTYNISSGNEELKEEITALSKKVTYLLLGQGDMTNESSLEYYERRNKYLELKYAPEIPKDPNSYSGYDETSQEYKDSILSDFVIPQMFSQLDELNITYNSIGAIRVGVVDDYVISMVSLPNATLKQENSEEPMKYDTVKTNLIMYYYFKKLNDEYKLYYLFGEGTDDLSQYFGSIEDNENTKNLVIAQNNDTKLREIYDFSKADSLDENKLNQIYNSNSKNILILSAYYNTSLVASANGVLISDGLVVTTWNFLEKALINSQFFAIKDNEGNSYQIDGIATANPETDLVVIKLKDKVTATTTLGNIDNVNILDAVMTISSKSGVGLSLQTGIVTSKDGYIQSAIPLRETDEGSPLYNDAGQLIGINTAKAVNTSVSLAIDVNALEEIKNKIGSKDFDSIKTVSFNELKEKYYYTNYNEEKIVNSISDTKWQTFKKIGDIENNIKLDLVKASYDNNVVSLRYKNGISKYINSMQLASSFKEELINTGYRETLNSSTKCIYVSNDYKVMIMDEFDYLIIVMVKL